MTVVIGIAGTMRSGKSTLAKELALSWDLPIVSFAESLRMEVAQAFYPKKQRTDARFWWSRLEGIDKTLTRPILQAWGQAKRDFFDEDYWVDRMFDYMKRKGMDFAICDDVRHENEAQRILDEGGIIIRLTADRQTLLDRGATASQLEHASEREDALDDIMGGRENPKNVNCFNLNTSGKSTYGQFVNAQAILSWTRLHNPLRERRYGLLPAGEEE